MKPEKLEKKSSWVRAETLKIHGLAPEIRIASCLSCVEIFSVLYYGKILRFDPKDPSSPGRDRLIVSKAHGAVSLYPVLADSGFFPMNELKRVCCKGSFLTNIPDCSVPGFETINGSLGQGLGVACGMALALKRLKSSSTVFVVMGDGELNEGSVWEAMIFAAHHRLDNLMLIIDNNRISMLDYCRKILDLGSLLEKFRSFGWKAERADGHSVRELYASLKRLKAEKRGRPKVLVAETVKGKGVKELENNPLCHIRTLTRTEIDKALDGIKW